MRSSSRLATGGVEDDMLMFEVALCENENGLDWNASAVMGDVRRYTRVRRLTFIVERMRDERSKIQNRRTKNVRRFNSLLTVFAEFIYRCI